MPHSFLQTENWQLLYMLPIQLARHQPTRYILLNLIEGSIMKFLLLLVLTSFGTSFASSSDTSILCQSADEKNRLETVDRNAYPSMTADEIMVKLVRPNSLDQYHRVHFLTLNRNVFLLNEESFSGRREAFKLSLGKMNLQNQYPQAKLVIKIDPYLGTNDRVTQAETLRFDLSCAVNSGTAFENACSSDDVVEYNNSLVAAVLAKDIDGVEQAIACGADVNFTDSSGCSPLMLSSLTQMPDCSRVNNQPRQTDIFEWAKAKFIFNYLLDEAADTTIRDHKGETVAHKVAQQGMAELVAPLKKAGADLNAQAELGFTPLMQATVRGYWKVIQEFVTADVDLSLKNSSGKTAYDLGEHLPKSIRNLLMPSGSGGIVILGSSSGCSPRSIEIQMSKPTKLTLKSSTTDMFLMESNDLGINLMAPAGGTASQIINTSRMGTFKFKCGVHGGRMMTGEIEVTM